MGTSFVFDDPDAMRSICGINDSNIPYLEKLLGCSIYVRGDRAECNTEESPTPQLSAFLFTDLMDRLKRLSNVTSEIGEFEILMEFKASQNASEKGSEAAPSKHEFISVLSRSVYPKSNRQEDYIKSMKHSQISASYSPGASPPSGRLRSSRLLSPFFAVHRGALMLVATQPLPGLDKSVKSRKPFTSVCARTSRERRITPSIGYSADRTSRMSSVSSEASLPMLPLC